MNSLVNQLHKYPYFNDLDVESFAARILVYIPLLNVALVRLKELHFAIELKSLKEKCSVVQFGKLFPLRNRTQSSATRNLTNDLSNLLTSVQKFEKLIKQKRKIKELIETARKVMIRVEIVFTFFIPFISFVTGFYFGKLLPVISLIAGIVCFVISEKTLKDCEESIRSSSLDLHFISYDIKNMIPQ